MKRVHENKIEIENRVGEKGAALVMVMLISFLLLIISAGILLEVTMNTANVTDATAEQQAYNAAESGIQATLNVLRGHTIPSPLIDDTKPANDPVNTINFKKALKLATSNKPGETSTVPRLSRWLAYNHTPSSSLIADRIILGKTTYNPLTDNAYKVVIEDPDNTGSLISYNTVGKINGTNSELTIRNSVNGTVNNLIIRYVPNTISNLNVSTGIANTDFGKFKLIVNGTGAAILDDVRFSIEVKMTVPYQATRVIRGWITTGVVTENSITGVKIDFDSKIYELMGSTFIIDNDPITPTPPNQLNGESIITGTMTPAEPIRLLVKSTGFGPRGANKLLEAVVQKNFFNGMTAPATLTLVGPPSGFAFDAGQSQNVTYSGDDVASDLMIPPIGTTNQQNLDSVNSNLANSSNKADMVGTPSNILAEVPTWLETAENLDATLQALKNVARSSGRYFPSGTTPTTLGDVANARGITYVDGNLSLDKQGGGILVVTGTLTLRGGFDFNGLIIVTGAGGVQRSGGGNGSLQGNVVIAPYNANNPAAGFLGPKYDISGGGISDITFNSSSLANGLTAVSNFVLGVAEK